jgi:hypothetical protein
MVTDIGAGMMEATEVQKVLRAAMSVGRIPWK